MQAPLKRLSSYHPPFIESQKSHLNDFSFNLNLVNNLFEEKVRKIGVVATDGVKFE